MHGGRSTGPKRKRDGRPATVKKPLDWCRPGASEILEGDLLFDVKCLMRLIDLQRKFWRMSRPRTR
jgi:hypothetical protein